MNIIRLDGGGYEDVITADNMDITADNMDITADNMELAPDTYVIRLIPRRFYPNMTLVLLNELTNILLEIEVIAEEDGNFVKITFVLENIQNSDSFEGTLYNEDKTDEIYRGKFFATNQNDLQEYTMTPKINNIIIM